jgi:hypothetical protein
MMILLWLFIFSAASVFLYAVLRYGWEAWKHCGFNDIGWQEVLFVLMLIAVMVDYGYRIYGRIYPLFTVSIRVEIE